PFLVEGWALYWELRLWDLDFPRSPEDRVGMLFWRSHRAARIIFSLGFHLGEMTPQECVALLVDRIGHEPRNATAEVRRSIQGGYGPLYQCAYLLGGLQLRELHAELVSSGRMSEREFHDAVLRENAIPIALIRARLSGATLERPELPRWRFYPGLEAGSVERDTKPAGASAEESEPRRSDSGSRSNEAGRGTAAGEDERARSARDRRANEPPRAYRTRVDPQWSRDGRAFWYRVETGPGESEHVLVDTERGVRELLFDPARVAKGLGDALAREVDPQAL